MGQNSCEFFENSYCGSQKLLRELYSCSSQIINYFVLRSKLRFLLDHFVSKKGIRFCTSFEDASSQKWKKRLENNEALISSILLLFISSQKQILQRLLLDQLWMGLLLEHEVLETMWYKLKNVYSLWINVCCGKKPWAERKRFCVHQMLTHPH